MTWEVLQGDCSEAMAEMEEASVDAVVCDPPYGLSREPDIEEVLRHWLAGDDYEHRGGGFMGRSWDSFVPGPSVWRECFRVLKPGGHLLAFAGSRTVDLMGIAIRMAGFEIRDSLLWLYGSGFPKSHDVSKAIDKRAGVEREVVGKSARHGGGVNQVYGEGMGDGIVPDLTAPATPEANQWEGWGTALKPAHEPIIVARKPLIGTVAENILEYGTGAINVDGCRISSVGPHGSRGRTAMSGYADSDVTYGDFSGDRTPEHPHGRWPANVVLSHTEECEQMGTKKVLGSRIDKPCESDAMESGYGGGLGGHRGARGFGAADGTETVEAWRCAPGCPVAALDEQSGELHWQDPATRCGTKPNREVFSDAPGRWRFDYGDKGGASRFFYCAKTSRAERNAGLENRENREKGQRYGDTFERGRDPKTGERTERMERVTKNDHPTVKPIDLMRWLVRLVTPPGGKILDPFLGSGSTGCAALLEGFDFLGIERKTEYVAIAEARISFWAQYEGKKTEDVLAAKIASDIEQRRRDVEGQLSL